MVLYLFSNFVNTAPTAWRVVLIACRHVGDVDGDTIELARCAAASLARKADEEHGLPVHYERPELPDEDMEEGMDVDARSLSMGSKSHDDSDN